MKARKLLSSITALALSLSLVAPAFAAQEGTSTGTGEVEFVYNKNIFSVELPITPETDYAYNFVLDPYDALKVSAADKIASGADAKKLYFSNWTDANNDQVVDEDEIEYGNTSDMRVIKNLSSFAVDVTLSVTVSNLGDLQLASDPSDWGSDGDLEDDAAMYLAIDGHTMVGAGLANNAAATESAEVVVEEDGTAVELKATLAAPTTYTDTDAVNPYILTTSDEKVTEENPKGYSYGWNEAYDHSKNTAASYYAFWLTGEINTSSTVDWKDLGTLASTVDITWSVEPDDTLNFTEGDFVDGNAPAVPAGPTVPTIEDVEITSDATTVEIKANLAGDAVAIGTVEYMFNGSTSFTALTSASYLEIDGDTMTLKGTHVTSSTKLIGKGGGTYKVTFVDVDGDTVVDEDGEAVTVTFTITVTD